MYNTNVKGKSMNGIIRITAMGAIAAVCGCVTGPVAFKESSAPVPMQGYTIAGSDVTGESSQFWILGFGGSLATQQHKAYKSAMSLTNGADALVGMSIESHSFGLAPFFIKETISVSGTPVKFNPPPSN